MTHAAHHRRNTRGAFNSAASAVMACALALACTLTTRAQQTIPSQTDATAPAQAAQPGQQEPSAHPRPQPLLNPGPEGAPNQESEPRSTPAADIGTPLGKAAKPAEKLAQRQEDDDNDTPLLPSKVHNPVLWHDPGDIHALDLFAGAGGSAHVPAPPFTFESEDMAGTNPKFLVKDAKDRKWKVKLGEEARPEVVASRLLWAMGYYVNDDYVLANAVVEGIHLQRGGNLVHHGEVNDARFERRPKGEKKIAIWDWKQNPFFGTRPFNGLRVMMAVMNNWDLKNVNNAVYYDQDKDQQLFLVSDVGATFGSNGLSFTKARSKGNIGTFKESKFITKQTPTSVSFATPSKPTGVLLESFGLSLPEFASRSSLGWLGSDIPRADAKWMGDMLGQLSHQQLVDAFRGGHFPDDQIEPYVQVVESRIAALQRL